MLVPVVNIGLAIYLQKELKALMIMDQSVQRQACFRLDLYCHYSTHICFRIAMMVPSYQSYIERSESIVHHLSLNNF